MSEQRNTLHAPGRNSSAQASSSSNRSGSTSAAPAGGNSAPQRTPQPQVSGAASVRWDYESFVKNDKAAAEMVRCAEELGGMLTNVSSSQIRAVYGSLKKQEMLGWRDETTKKYLKLLKPRLAYARARAENISRLEDALKPMIDAVTDEDEFERFCRFVEAVLAYHKASGGR